MTHIPKKVIINSTTCFTYSFNLKSLENDWNQVGIPNIYLQPAYLNALENSILSDIIFIYVIVYQNNKPVGVLYFQWIHVGTDFFNQKKFPNEIHSKITARILKSVNGNLLLCGNFFATGTHGFYFTSKLSPKTIPLLINKLKVELCAVKNTSKLKFIMVKEFWLDQEIKIQKELCQKNARFQIDVNMILEIHKEWTSFDNYLAFMVTKYRTRAKSVFKKTEGIVVQNFTANDIKTHANTIHQLYNSVLETASFNMVRLSVDSFYQLKINLKEKFIFTGYFKDHQLIAFSTACLNNHYLDANFVGINYQINQTLPIYQRILYDYVKLAIHKKVIELRLGRTAEIMKSSLGAIPKEMNLYIKHTNPLLHLVLKPLTEYVTPSNYEIRKPFKKSYYS
ncbi:hypothetical protein FHR24_002875 [Wenyingzhuangia heitensis]|uniref:Acetyltransferase (GNAT) domain-containing protein n=1 Tax=Wenyingzhuangia heitensis TaxID=1487859 RepID=A0ABX0UCC3_9FLAO|nr:peptidogalycan biosysnthesis protein [Wenyingzhuangia heitensis]NIJ46388.1 hypothetical protein [Wenyingzhuangia heitensis]